MAGGTGTQNVGKVSKKQKAWASKLPFGKTVRVAVFTSGKNADAAKAAGADIVGLDDLAAKVKAGEINFDVVVASPDAMRVVGQLGQILGPRGLMPNPKVGTVTRKDVEEIARLKLPDLNTDNVEAAIRSVSGTARSMGLDVVG